MQRLVLREVPTSPAPSVSQDYPNGSKASLVALLVTQTLLSFAANAAKILVFALALSPGVLPVREVPAALAILTALLAAPYLALSPLLAWLTDRFSSRGMLQLGITLQLAFLGGLALAFHERSGWLAVGAFLLLTIQSALVSPAKRAMLREVSPERKFNPSVLLLEMLTITAIVAGAYAGARALDWTTARTTGDTVELWRAAEKVALGLAAVTGGALLTFLPAARTPAGQPPAGVVPIHAPAQLGARHPVLLPLWRRADPRID